MNKTLLAIVKFGVIFLVLALFVGSLYDIGIHRPPLKYAEIPMSTRDYIDNLGKNNRGQGLTYKDQGPFDWDNKEDYGCDLENKWAYEEDDNFIVYYKRDKDAVWQSYAQQILSMARDNIGLLEDLFGCYYYAKDMNGRRLAIYLPNDKSLYREVVSQLMDKPNYNVDGTAGVTITEVGPLGCLTKGIVLNPSCFEFMPNHPSGFGTVLKHEMSHYVFFSALDYGKNISHYLWVSEGIAEYFCNNSNKSYVTGEDSVMFIDKKCKLNMEFPNEMNSAYWAGESFFRYLEDKSGAEAVIQFVRNAYTLSTDSIFAQMKYDAKEIHLDWVRALRSSNILPLDTLNTTTPDALSAAF